MIILIIFAFLSGIVTILSPCILPVLPIVLSGSLTGGKKRPLGIVTGFVFSFTFFTLFLSAIVRATHVPPDALRTVAVVLLVIFGAALFLPQFQGMMEKFFSRLNSFFSQSTTHNSPPTTGFWSGLPIGASLGLIWAPCVGPIIASVITLAATSTVTSGAFFITLAYSIGTAFPMLGVTYGGRALLNRVPWLVTRTRTIQKVFGVLMVLTAIGIFFNIDRKIQTYILTVFPNYGVGLTKFEENSLVQNALSRINPRRAAVEDVGKPMNELQLKTASMLPRIGKAPGFIHQDGAWINSEPLTMEGLRGNVVLVDFWTYTCINCIRTLPYLASWWEKYKDKGLVIVGVHTPEFEFEKNLANVQKAVNDFHLTYPIVQDNSYGIWQDYDNHYWPAKYLIDKDGYIRNVHFGEGSYDETEKNIQALLEETGQTITDSVNNAEYSIHAQTPETYLGYEREEFSVSPESITRDQPATYTAPSAVPLNRFAYEGLWSIGGERAMPFAGAKLHLNFSAQNVFLVMRPKIVGSTGKVRVLLNNASLGSVQAGEDVANSTVTVSDDRLYTLITLEEAGQGIITLEFLDDSVELYAFTFG